MATKVRERASLTEAAIKSIKFTSDYRCFNKGDKFEMRPGLNLLVGDQGCGKSTLISCMCDDKDDQWDLDVDPVEFRFLDTEKMNPRTVGDINNARDVGFTIASKFMSHGQTLLPMVEACKEMRGYILFLDEPEAALSIRSQIKVANAIAEAAKHNQVIACTHNPYIIRQARQVLDLERKMWTDAEEFIKYQENGKPGKKK